MRATRRMFLPTAQLVLVAAALALQAACGADTTIEGPGLVASADGAGGGDSTVQQSDGGGGLDAGAGSDASGGGDAQVGQDGTINPPQDTAGPDGGGGDGGVVKPDAIVTDPSLSCAGKCGQAKPNQWKCQCDAQCSEFGDCCGDYAALCSSVGPGPGPDPTPAEIIACLEGACAKPVAQCTSNPTCNKFWNCAKGCDNEQCLQACTAGLDIQALAPILQPLMTCGEQAGCTGGTVTPPDPGPICGDGTCEQPENSLNCLKDCPNQPAGEVQKCLAAKCSTSYKACFSAPQCVAAVACINEGNQPQECVSDPKTGQLLNAMLSCGAKNGCLGGNPSSCGNGQCDNGETSQSCPSDCQVVVPPTDSVTKCLMNGCGKIYNSCASSSACMASLSCVVSGGSLMSCVKDPGTYQTLASLVQCGTQQKCFSGGGGGASCQGKCGQFIPGAACQCNAECKSFGNCCGDWAKLCATTPGPVCGDGVCSAPAESSQTCPGDCGEPVGKFCKSKADCASTEICCGKADGSQVCTPPAKCM